MVFTKVWAENWTSTNVMTLKEHVLFFRSENMATLALRNVADGDIRLQHCVDTQSYTHITQLAND